MKPKFQKTKQFAAIVTALMLLFQPWHARADDASKEDVQALLQRIKELEERVKVLERNREVDQEVNGEKAKAEPTVVLGSKGLIVRSPDTNYVMNIHGYVQGDGRFYLHDANTANDTFLIRRARPIIEGTVYDSFDYKLMLDLASGNVTSSSAGNNLLLDDAWVNARFWRQLQFQAGKFKSPVGLERLKNSADLVFVESGLATSLTPNYDTGVELHNNLFNTPLNYAIGVFNGAADNTSDDAEVNDEGKDVAGRVFAQPFLNAGLEPLRGLGFGVGGSTGKHIGTLPAYKTPGQQTFFAYSTTAANTVTANGVQYRLDPQAFYYWGPFGVLGEYVLSSSRIQSTAALPRQRFNNRAWQVEASWFLTGEENTFGQPRVLRPFGVREGRGWGAFELVATASQLTLDNDLFTPHGGLTYAAANSARSATSWGAGVNWYLNNNMKLNLDYDSTSFHGGSAAPGTVTSREEHAILSRVQIAF